MEIKADKFPNKGDYVIFFLGAILIIIATIFDLTISEALYNPDSLIGNFTAQYGELPGYLLVLIALSILWYRPWGVFKESAIAPYRHGILLVVSLLPAYLISSRLVDNLYLQLLIAAVISSVVFQVVGRTGDELDDYLSRASYYLIQIILIGPLFLVLSIKIIWGRVRFRDLVNSTEFSPWYLPQGFTGHTSFPSGHTAMGWFLVAGILLFRDSRNRLIYLVISVIWAITVSFGRVLIGAHYLSDITFSFLILYSLIRYYASQQLSLNSE